MATETLQHPDQVGKAQARRFTGRVTGNAYSINPLGQATVDTRDAPQLLCEGWIPVLGAGGGSGQPTSGIAVIDFGAFPGSPYASTTLPAIDVSDPNAVLDAWIVQVATIDHSADEHAADPPLVAIVADGQGNIIITGQPSGRDLFVPPGVPPGNLAASQAPIGRTQLMPVGKWSVGWAFSP